MSPAPQTISFLSDFGTDDESVGVVKSVIRSIAPDASVIDLTHGIPAHDVRAGSLALARAVQYVAPGVILAVVDPGVGTERRAVAVEVAEGLGTFVGPDNGLLASAVAMAGGATRAVHLNDPEYHLEAPGMTFAGRDVFAPVAAHLCAGVDLDDIGEAIDPAGLLPGTLPLSREEDGRLVAEVLWVDRYGNLQLNLDPDEVIPFGERITLRADDMVRTAGWASTYDVIRPGEVGLVIDAYGLVSLCMARHPASSELGLDTGDAVTLESAGDAVGIEQPVSLGLRRPHPGEPT
ncbi:MAG TPA: SAM-dependent chlorinase/fluorinase [Acidimicrobiales bacterium]|nr:SAM-dependent chlorinase/fluorinase [Acidimicrobiales bacterium]